jgi:HNH endonuclease
VTNRTSALKPRKPVAMKQGRTKKARQFADELDAITPALIERAGGQCEARIAGVCGTGLSVMHRHHKLMRSHGGSNDIGNLLYLCDGCHVFIHLNPTLSYEMGWLVRSGVLAGMDKA